MAKITIEKKHSEKKNKDYVAIFIEVEGYKTSVNFDKIKMSKLANVSLREIDELQEGEIIEVK